MAVLSVAIQGATGRMGTRLIQLIREDPALTLGAALERPDHPELGRDVGELLGLGPLGVPLEGRLGPERNVGAAIDFSSPAGALPLADACAGLGVALVIGTTGLEPDHKAQIERHAATIPLLISPNLCRAVNLLMKLAGEAARMLGASADIEIIERHHHHKKDAPSGTALRIAEVVAESLGAGPDRFIFGRSGQVGARPAGEIGIHALRTGDNPGEHTVVFGLPGEVIELTHRAYNRDGFARGALDAAKFLADQPPGLYTMNDLLRLS